MPRPIPDPYAIHFKVFLSDGSAAGSSDLLQIVAEDVYDGGTSFQGDTAFGTGGVLLPLQLEHVSEFSEEGRTRPNLRFYVHDPMDVIVHTTQIFHAIPAGSTVQIVLTVGDALVNVPDEPGPNRVFGHVHNALDLPVLGIRVLAYHLSWTRDGLTEQALGSDLTDGAGNYSISYDLPEPTGTSISCSTPTEQLHIIVYAHDPASQGIDPLATSPVIFNAAAEQEVNLVVDRPAVSADSEYQRLDDKLANCLGDTDEARYVTLNLLDRRPEYLAFVAQTVAEDEGSVRAYVRGWLIAGEINEKVPAAALSEPMLPEAIFGLVRFGLGDSLQQLLDVQPNELYAALVESIHQGVISADIEAELQRSSSSVTDSLLDDWRIVLSAMLTQAPADPATETDPWQRQLLELVLSDLETRQAVARAHFDDPDAFVAMLDGLVEDETIRPDEAEDLQFVFELYDELDRYYPIVAAIYPHKEDRGWHTIRDLANVALADGPGAPGDLDDWGFIGYALASLAHSDGQFPGDVPGRNDEEKAAVYGKRLFDRFHALEPRAPYVTRLAVLATSTSDTDLENATTFLANYPAFDLETSNLDQFLAAESITLPQATAQKVKQVQRVYRLTSDADSAANLISAGLDSAVAIARLDEDQFIAAYEQSVGGLTHARDIHRTASHYASEVLFTLVKFHQNLNNVGGILALPGAIDPSALDPTAEYNPDLVDENPVSTGRKFPNWITLFGDFSKCACQHCQTVLSPGAYLVDLLQFVAGAPKRTLFERRPDLADIELTCPNTNKTLPYIDLVNEVLEAVVASPAFVLSGNVTTTVLNDAVNGNSSARQTVRNAFDLRGHVLSERARYKHGAADNPAGTRQWVIEEDAWRFTIGGTAAPFNVLPAPQTSALNDTLEVFPEHFNQAAYAELETARFPFNLPLALGKEEIGVFLDQRKTGRHEILEAFTIANEDALLQSNNIALAYLGLVQSEADAILTIGASWESHWGFNTVSPVTIRRPDKPTVEITGTYGQLLSLVPVFLHRTGLRYTELLDLMDVQFVNQQLAPPASHGLHILAETDDIVECNYNEFQIGHLNLTTLRRIGVFLRLWRRLGWSMRTLDRYLMDMEGGQIPTSLVRLFQVKRLADELGVPPLVVFSWWRPIDNRRTRRIEKSLFDEVFLVGVPTQPEVQAIERVARGQAIGSPYVIDLTPPLNEDYRAYLRAALRLRADDMDALWGEVIGGGTTLGFSQLSRMYRIVTFCAALKLSIREYLDVIDLVDEVALPNPEPVDLGAAILATHRAVREIRRVQSIGLPAAQIIYTLRHVSEAGDPFVPTTEDFDAAIVRLASANATITAAFPDVAEPNTDALTTNLARIMPADRVMRAIQIVQGPTPPSDPSENRAFLQRYFAPFLPTDPEEQEDFLDFLVNYSSDLEERYAYVWAALHRHLVEQARTEAAITVASELMGLSADSTNALLTGELSSASALDLTDALADWRHLLRGGWLWLSGDPPTIAHVPTLENAAAGSYTTSLVVPRNGEYHFVARVDATSGVEASDIVIDLEGTSIAGAVASPGSGWTDVIFPPVALRAGAVHELQVTSTSTDSVSLLWRIDNADPVPVPSTALVPFEQAIHLKLFKPAQLVLALRLSPSELRYLLGESSALDLDALPLTPPPTGIAVPWATLATFVDELGLNRSIAIKTGSLFDLWDRVSGDTTYDEIAVETGWTAEDLQAVRNRWEDPLPEWDDPALWFVLRRTSRIIRRLDLRASQIIQHLLAAPTIAAANALRSAFRAQYSLTAWKDAFKPPRDRLRQKQRDALVGYLTTRPITQGGRTYHFFDANDLYGHFLIDVEMEPDTQISRIVLATNAIQLFVQRVFLGLEDRASLIELDKAKEQWEWMRAYRVWEAARKVFLFPENWIRPELRDDKTPFFVELEDELLQDEITNERGETALRNYLEKLIEVSNLEVFGSYVERVQSGGTNFVVHVLARTRSQPRVVYYRKFEARQAHEGKWTSWRTVDLEIDADLVVPIPFNGRLHLAWPMLTAKQKANPPSGDFSKVDAEFRTEIRLVWSEYNETDAKWLKPRISKSYVFDPRPITPFERPIGEDRPSTNEYHLRVEAVGSEFVSVGLIRTNRERPDSDLQTIGAVHLGNFQIWSTSDDTFEATDGIASRIPTTNWPIGTLLKHGRAVETSFMVHGEVAHGTLQFKDSVAFFGRTPGTFHVFEPNFAYIDDTRTPFFYETTSKSLFALHKGLAGQVGLGQDLRQIAAFQTFHHPLIRELQTRLRGYGPPGIMNRLTEALPVADNRYYSNYYYNYYGHLYLGYHIAGDRQAWSTTQRMFENEHHPREGTVRGPYPLPTIEFGYGTSFGIYNWELFFHLPILVADRLHQELKFEEAMKWFHYVFDPKLDLNNYEKTKGWVKNLPHGSRYWNFLPFFANKDATDSLLETLGLKSNLSTYERQQLAALVDEWRQNPFNPHLIARQRIVAYQKNVVMRYLDNLIAWADQLFRQDSFESINQATQLYILADELLGERPQEIEPLTAEPRYTYRELEEFGLDPFSNAIVEVENLLATNRAYIKDIRLEPQSPGLPALRNLTLQTFYFQIPRNDQLDRYWDTVQDRLFKIRNSMNIDGVKRQLALFQPPIDPALLVRAAAAGLDLGSVLSQLNAPLPHYRFSVWIQRALDLANEVRGFGAALLAALEKKDGEQLQRLRQDQEIRMLQLVRQVRQQQVDEANLNIQALQASHAIAAKRWQEYHDREEISAREETQISLTKEVTRLEAAQGINNSIGAFLAIIPQFSLGGPTPIAQTTFGGANLNSLMQGIANALGTDANIKRAHANLAGTRAGHDRRWEDWKLQEQLALLEMTQISVQILVAQIRLHIAQKELANHEQQIEHAEQVKEFLESKFTNQELYQWMISELSRTHQQVYKLAFDVAKTAERTFKFELGLDDAEYIQFNYIDSLHKGLLAGERLVYDLKRLDIAFLERNKREFEIQKPISLATFNAAALQDLRETGSCTFEFPEVLFDLDFPGQYFRRIKAVRLSIPCVVGPYTNVSAKLSLLGSAVRTQGTADPENYAYTGYDDPRFVHDRVGIQSIATSTAQSDAGLFELNFRDERYLPFEGAGAISRWRLELPGTVRQFDYGTISDVVIHLSYTARDGGGLLAEGATRDIDQKLNHLLRWVSETETGLVRVFSLRKEFPDAFESLLAEEEVDTEITLEPEHFPYVLRSIPDLSIAVVGEGEDPVEYPVDVRIQLRPGGEVESPELTLNENPVTGLGEPDDNNVIVGTVNKDEGALIEGWAPETWTLQQIGLTSEAVDDILLIVRYRVSLPAEE